MTDKLEKLENELAKASDRLISAAYYFDDLEEFERSSVQDLADFKFIELDKLANKLRSLRHKIHQMEIIDGYRVTVNDDSLALIVGNREYEDIKTLEDLKWVVEQEGIPAETAEKIFRFYLRKGV